MYGSIVDRLHSGNNGFYAWSVLAAEWCSDSGPHKGYHLRELLYSKALQQRPISHPRRDYFLAFTEDKEHTPSYNTRRPNNKKGRTAGIFRARSY